MKQILFISTLGNVQGTLWRICILLLGWKGLKACELALIISAAGLAYLQLYPLSKVKQKRLCFILQSEGTTRCRLCGTRFPPPLALNFPIGQKNIRGEVQMMMVCSEVVLLRIFIRRQTNFLVTLGFHLVMFLFPSIQISKPCQYC